MYTVPELLQAGLKLKSDYPDKTIGQLFDICSSEKGGAYLIAADTCDEVLLGAIALLRQQSLKVHVDRYQQDSVDTDLSSVGCATGAILDRQQAVKQSKVVIWLFETEPEIPVWLLWLLGLAEGSKAGSCAVWPIAESQCVPVLNNSLSMLLPQICHEPDTHPGLQEKAVRLQDFVLQNTCSGLAT